MPIWNEPPLAYVCVPVISKPPLGSTVMTPVDFWPSPHWMEATNESADAVVLLVKVATMLVKAFPAWASNDWPVTLTPDDSDSLGRTPRPSLLDQTYCTT